MSKCNRRNRRTLINVFSSKVHYCDRERNGHKMFFFFFTVRYCAKTRSTSSNHKEIEHTM